MVEVRVGILLCREDPWLRAESDLIFKGGLSGGKAGDGQAEG
jgi:hypothetical protein